jgi:hypothetical protein
MGFGLGALIFNLILLQLMNPNNESLDADKRYSIDVANNLPYALRVMSSIYLALGLLGVFLIRPPMKQDDDQESLT